MNDSMMSTDGSHTELHQLQLQSLLLGISSDASSKGEGCVVTFLLWVQDKLQLQLPFAMSKTRRSFPICLWRCTQQTEQPSGIPKLSVLTRSTPVLLIHGGHVQAPLQQGCGDLFISPLTNMSQSSSLICFLEKRKKYYGAVTEPLIADFPKNPP